MCSFFPIESMLVRVEYSFLLVLRWKLMSIKQQLQVPNFPTSEQEGNLAIINMGSIIGKVRQRQLDFN